jgi:hypothetical protein
MWAVHMSSESVMGRMALMSGVAFLMLHAATAFGAEISLAWKPSVNAVGYNVYYGVAHRDYTSSLDAGPNTMMTVTGLEPGQTYYFAVTAYNANDVESRYSNEVTNRVTNLPVLLSEPKSQTVVLGTTAFLSVDFLAAPPVSFRWFFDAMAMPGATNALLALPDISEEDAGDYTVVLSNSAGSVTSTVAVIDVLQPILHKEERHATAARQAVPAGVYNGLFYQTDEAGVPAMTPAATGFLGHCVIDMNGYYSARLACAGRSDSFSGVLNDAGEGTVVVSRSDGGLSNLLVSLQVSLSNGIGRLTGFVSNMDPSDPWVAPLTTRRATNAYPHAAALLLFSPPLADQFGNDLENHQCWLTVASNGFATLFGRLDDGAQVWQMVPISGDGSIPLYVSLGHDSGLLAGWVHVSRDDPIGNLTWIRPAGPSEVSPGPPRQANTKSQVNEPVTSSSNF